MNSPKDRSRRDMLTLMGSAATLALVTPGLPAQQAEDDRLDIQEYPYTIADQPWAPILGNHRVRIHVAHPAEAVWVHVPWRRCDENPEQKAILVFDADGTEVLNVDLININDEFGSIVFKAIKYGDYFIYYLPHEEIKEPRSVLGPKGQYRKPIQKGSATWLKRNSRATGSALHTLPKAEILEFESRTALDSFYPMLVPATVSELQSLCKKYPQQVLLFTEDREHPIQMDDRLPLRWIQSGPRTIFNGNALRGEFYVFQVGVFLRKDSLATSIPVDIQFSDMIKKNGETIASSHWTCLNTNKIDAYGNSSHQQVQVQHGEVLPFWCGVHIPLEAGSGVYKGTVYVLAGSEQLSVEVELNVCKDFIRAAGVDQGWRLARTQWLNSKLGLDESITKPYKPIQLEGKTVSVLGREISLADSGLPVSIHASGKEIIASPISLSVNGEVPTWRSTWKTESTTDAKIIITSVNESDHYTLTVRTTIEFDGSANFGIKFVCKQSQSISDIALNIIYLKDSVPYAVGMGLTGGRRQSSWNWKWSQQPQRWKDQGSNLDYFLWLGDVDAGLYCRLTSSSDGWRNENRGVIAFEQDHERVFFKASSGPRTINTGETLDLSFRLLPTPVKPFDPQHWKERYAHSYQPPAKLNALGATVNNIHQGTLPNMYINYPFLNLDLLIPYVSESHALGMKVKIYYTMRELTTRLPELWTFRSLGDEIYRIGGTQGQGDPQLDFWLQEHLRHDYSPGWITQTSIGDIDTSLRVHSNSRLTNFYVEGLNWLLMNAEIDGLYLDEIGYSRSTMQRVRRVLERRPGAMIDMHGNHDWWSCNCPIGYYMEHLPYIDRLWLGEAFDPDSSPEFWLIEMSGIPFGLSSDLLENPNLWRGMLFGMTNRVLYTGPSPTAIWKLWDDFGIEDANLVGWWSKDPIVKTGHPHVLATAYTKTEKCLIAIASWAKEEVNIHLEIDWQEMNIDPKLAQLSMPDLGYFQKGNNINVDDLIQVPPGKGYLLLIKQ